MMNNKKFIVVGSILIIVLSSILIILLGIIYSLNKGHQETSKMNIVSNDKKVRVEDKENNEEIIDNSMMEEKAPLDILNELQPDIRIQKFYEEKDYEEQLEFLFYDTIADAYSEKMLCDKVLSKGFDELLNILESKGYEETENSDTRIFLGKEKTYKNKDIDDYKTEVFLDSNENMIQIVGDWYSSYDTYCAEHNLTVNNEDYNTSKCNFLMDTFNNPDMSNDEKIAYSIKAIQQIDVSKNSMLKYIYSSEELQELQSYLRDISFPENIEDISYFGVETKIGDTRLKIKVLLGWEIIFQISNIGYETSQYNSNFEKLKEHCLSKENRLLQNEIEYAEYINLKYGFSVSYPDIFQNKVEGDADDGIILFTEDESIKIMVYSQYNIDDTQPEQQYSKEIEELENIETSLLQGNWYEISWKDNQKMYYRKRYIDEDILYNLEIEYPITNQAEFEKIIPNITKSFNVKLDTIMQ